MAIKFDYSTKSLLRHVRPDDFYDFKIKKEDLRQDIDKIVELFYINAFNPQAISIKTINNHAVFMAGSLYDAILNRNTAYILYNLKLANAASKIDIMRMLISTLHGLKTSKGCRIIRADIKHFYESIDIDILLEKLRDISVPECFNHIEKIMAFSKINNLNGLPRGLSQSSPLSEIYLSDFDREMLSTNGVILYVRYVDDIIIIHDGAQNDTVILEKMDKLLKAINLERHTAKNKNSANSLCDDFWLDYLGYSIHINRPDEIRIAQGKLNKIKTRIALSIAALKRDKNKNFFRERIRFLTGNTYLTVHRQSTRDVYTGCKYAYRFADQVLLLKQLSELDKFKNNLLNSRRYKPSICLRAALTPTELSEILSLSFNKGYREYPLAISRDDMAKIKRAWAK